MIYFFDVRDGADLSRDDTSIRQVAQRIGPLLAWAGLRRANQRRHGGEQIVVAERFGHHPGVGEVFQHLLWRQRRR